MVRRTVHRRIALGALLGAMLILAAALLLGVRPAEARPGLQEATPTAPAPTTTATAPTGTPAPAPPVATAVPTPAGPAQAIIINGPPENTVIGSPVTITGRTARYPHEGQLGYRFVNVSQQTIGSGTFPVSGAPGGPTTFVASLSLNLPPEGGAIRLDIFDRDPATGAPVATVDWDLMVAEPQFIAIDSPGSGAQVGSPVTITGRTGQLPNQARLVYTVTGSDGRQLGSGAFPVAGSPGAPAFFSASLTFAAPLEGDNVTLQLLDQDAAGGVAATATLPLVVAPAPQQIIVNSPGVNAYVGTPVVIAGRTVRYPLQGNLGYAIYDSNGQQVGGGVFNVAGNLQVGGTFNATLGFNYPPQGGTLRIDLYDQDANTGQFRATTSVNLRTVPLQQSIVINSPGNGAQVGSPVTITGGTARYPNGGVLQWRISDGSGNVLGAGSFQVQGPFGEPTRFSASLGFNPPPVSSGLRADVFETDQFGNVVASASVNLSWVVAQPPVPQIFIDTPPQNIAIGSPVVVTGRTNFLPFESNLSYRVRDAFGNVLGQGGITVQPQGNNSTRFVGSLSYGPPPSGSQIFIDVYVQDQSNGAIVASATITVIQG